MTVILCFYLFLDFSPKLKVTVTLKPQTLLFCNLRELKWGTVSVTVTKAEYDSFTVRKHWKQTCLFRWISISLMVHFSINITICMFGQTNSNFNFQTPAFQLFVCSLQKLLFWLHDAGAQVLSWLGMNPSGWSLEYSLHNLGEGHGNQSSSASLPSEQTYGRGAPWTPTGDGD